MLHTSETIAAICTPATRSAIGIIRVSGPKSIEIVDSIFCHGKYTPINDEIHLNGDDSHDTAYSASSNEQATYDKSSSDRRAHLTQAEASHINPRNRSHNRPSEKAHYLQDSPDKTIHYGHIVVDGQMLDEVLVMLMRAPHTYTGEDVVEVHCHGGTLVLESVLQAILAHGARLSAPGEFSKRAFLNGKMDISKAQSVMDVINAKSSLALKSSLSRLSGRLSEKISSLRASILHEIAFIEAALDDPEHYSLDGYESRLLPILFEHMEEILDLMDTAHDGRVINEGIKTVIIGRPNAGKSSVYNLLAGAELAIVTDIAGTTRDMLSSDITLGGIALNIIDTAGIRDSKDAIEQIGIERARAAISGADLVLCVVDGSRQLDDEDRALLSDISDRRAITLLNKSDIATKISDDEINALAPYATSIVFSAKDGSGYDELVDTIRQMFLKGDITMNDELLITREREVEALNTAYDALMRVVESIQAHYSEDIYTIDLTEAYEALGIITGESLEDDIVDAIFAQFCMGK